MSKGPWAEGEREGERGRGEREGERSKGKKRGREREEREERRKEERRGEESQSLKKDPTTDGGGKVTVLQPWALVSDGFRGTSQLASSFLFFVGAHHCCSGG